jgi:hypothetical protein
MQQASVPAIPPVRVCGGKWLFLSCWIAANAVAELIGLGTSGLLWMAFFSGMEAQLGIVISAVVVVVGSTLLEGTAVGVLQGLVLRRALPTLRLTSWWGATAIGALIAWSLGMIPSTLMALAEDATAAPPPVMSDVLMYGLAAVMGLVLGPILALPQWWVLRRHVNGAGLWIIANAIAWAWGMIIIFAAMGAIPETGVNPTTILIILGGLTAAGAMVGAIHGYVLITLLKLK